MSYLARLKASVYEKMPTEGTDRADKSPSVSFVSAQGSHISELDEGKASSLRDPAAEDRRQRVVAILQANPMLRYAVVCDGDGDPVPVAIAIRDKGTCEVHIPAARFDPFALIELVGKHGGTLH